MLNLSSIMSKTVGNKRIISESGGQDQAKNSYEFHRIAFSSSPYSCYTYAVSYRTHDWSDK